MMKRISRILAALLALSILSSCSKTPDTQKDLPSDAVTTDSQDTTDESDTRITPDLPEDVRFDGEHFVYLHWLVSAWGMTGVEDLVCEEATGEPVDDAVYRRNSMISEKYGVKFGISYEEQGDLPNTYRNVVLGDLHSYDVVIPILTSMSSVLTNGCCYDLNKLPYLDFTKPWWDQKSTVDLSIDGSLYMVASDIIISEDKATAAFLFNKKLAEDYSLPDLYQLVNEGKWTLSTLYEYSKGVSGDLNGDSKLDANDRFGILGQHDFALAAFNGAGSKFAAKDSDDLPYDSFNTERNIAVCEKILDIMYDDGVFFNAHMAGMDQTWDMFAENKGLFRWSILGHVANLRQSDVDFGILPTPKYDEAQDGYYNMVNPHNCGLLTVPSNSASPEMTGIILEALAAESKYTLRSAYYDITLEGKSLRDTESEAMLDLIIENRIYDAGSIYDFGNFAMQWLYIAASGNKDVVSFHERYAKSITKDIDKLVKKIQTVD